VIESVRADADAFNNDERYDVTSQVTI
jgi:hypothetical protein